METLIEDLMALPTPFNFVAVVGMFAILCGLIYACYTAYLSNALKREMLSKGMSAEDIERVINAGKGSSEIEDQSSKQRTESHAGRHIGGPGDSD